MRAPYIKLSFCLCFLFLITDTSIAQEKNPTKYSYGGDVDSLGRLSFKEKANFWRATFDTLAEFWLAKFYSNANFNSATFDTLAEFWSAKFYSVATFVDATFDGYATFFDATFDGRAQFGYATFDSGVDFGDATFDSYTTFGDAKFDSDANFRSATFNSGVNFGDAKFDSCADFLEATFDGRANFRRATFDGDANFREATFEDVTFFQKTVLKGVVNFQNTTFKKEIDFRQSNFDSVTVIYLEDISFPEGKLRFYWEQFKGKDSLRIKLINLPTDSIKDDHYTRIEIIYHKLRDNFLTQGNQSSADDVMYELGWQRDEILDEFWWGLYGSLFGYGYQPWRFLLYIVTPIILLFAFTLYWFYYTLLAFINQSIFHKIVDASALRTKEIYLINIINIRLFKIHITDFKYGLENVNRLTRYWHTIFFSASVLLGIRFKKDWTTVFPKNMIGRKTFIYFVTFEWILGIGLFVTFALLVEGIRFSFIKDLLGF